MTDDQSWRDAAECRDVEPELFFATTYNAIKEAKAICGGCPSIEPCLNWAYEINDKYAVLGGLTPRQRAKTRAAWRRDREELSA